MSWSSGRVATFLFRNWINNALAANSESPPKAAIQTISSRAEEKIMNQTAEIALSVHNAYRVFGKKKEIGGYPGTTVTEMGTAMRTARTTAPLLRCSSAPQPPAPNSTYVCQNNHRDTLLISAKSTPPIIPPIGHFCAALPALHLWTLAIRPRRTVLTSREKPLAIFAQAYPVDCHKSFSG